MINQRTKTFLLGAAVGIIVLWLYYQRPDSGE